ncbi:MAG: ABC transporter permease subunit, partial [Actinomycetota bacterium]|nr:ABC transporter permease subunit [Actinomycetota bacterium]
MSTAPMSPATWVRHNLFRNRRDAITTVIAAVVVGWVVFQTLRFVFGTARWEVVRANLTLFLVGRYPADEQWRIVAVLIAAAAVAGLVTGVLTKRRRRAAIADDAPLPPLSFARRLGLIGARYWPALVLLLVLLLLARTSTPWVVAGAVIVAAVVGRLVGGALPPKVGIVLYALPVVLPFVALPFLTGPLGWDDWGGMMLTILLATVSMIACFPLGLLLALGRRSTLPALRGLSIGVIEFFRGVPLVALVLMSDVGLGFFFPRDALPGRVVRVTIAFTIFTAAYVAEIVRGGLQSVPRGQTEA